MSEKLSEVLECYDLEISSGNKSRYAHIFETDKGYMQLRPMDISESRLKSEYTFKEKLFEEGFCNIDRCVPNKEEELATPDRYGNNFVLRRYFKGREINVNNISEILLAVENLASFHIVGRRIWNEIKEKSDEVHVIRDDNDFARRNIELKRVRNYISKVSPKQKFEEIYIRIYGKFYIDALECERKIKDIKNDTNEHIGYCHGMYNNHSILMCHDNSPGEIATVGFDRFYIGNQLADLYYFARKISEKNSYSFDMVKMIIEKYDSIIKLSDDDFKRIYLMFSYPEKFYKLSSQYINASKSRISPMLLEKIGKIIETEELKRQLLLDFRNIFLHI